MELARKFYLLFLKRIKILTLIDFKIKTIYNIDINKCKEATIYGTKNHK